MPSSLQTSPLTGWTQEAVGQPLASVIRIINEDSGRPVKIPTVEALREERTVKLASHSPLIARDGTQRAISDSAGPITNDKGEVAGVVLVFCAEICFFESQCDCDGVTIAAAMVSQRPTPRAKLWIPTLLFVDSELKRNASNCLPACTSRHISALHGEIFKSKLLAFDKNGRKSQGKSVAFEI